MQYPVRPIPFDPRDFATHKSLQRVAAFTQKAGSGVRQAALEYVATAHALSTAHTKSLLYDPNLDLPGRNVRGHVRIGPLAFEQDLAWLAGIVFHELIHSPQYAYYAARGVAQIDPKRSEPERLMIALDEFEAYWWSLQRNKELALSGPQISELRRRAQHALIDLDDPEAAGLAQKQRFDAARDALIRQYRAMPGTAVSAAKAMSRCVACCA